MPAHHPLFKEPENTNTKIWRYMDFTKFVAMLDGNGLYFGRANLLGDPFEGSYPLANIRSRQKFFESLPQEQREKTEAQWSRSNELFVNWTFISCWHMSEHESAAMWKLYAKSDEAIAIQTTYQLLWNCLPDKAGDGLYLGTVEYIDYEIGSFPGFTPPGNSIQPFLHKRLSYEHEKELRAVMTMLPIEDGTIYMNKQQDTEGEYVKVNLNSLIQEVHVAPATKPWLRNLVESAARKYNLACEVKQSNLDNSPIY